MQALFTHPVVELIRQRQSCRTFAETTVPNTLIESLQQFASSLRSPFGSTIRLAVLDKEKVQTDQFFTSGTYGMLRGTRFFLAGIIRKGDSACWEDLGWLLEHWVLRATDLGLGTCWIGGVFDRKRFGRQLNMQDSELLPAVVAFGLPAEQRSWRDRLVRWSARGDMRKPFMELFFAGAADTPLTPDRDPVVADLLEALRLAPSASNKQPWRVIRQDNKLLLCLRRSPGYRNLIPNVDLQRIDMGIAMAHLELAAAASGRPGRWHLSQAATCPVPPDWEMIGYFELN